MADHDYTPRDALGAILERVTQRDRTIGERIEIVINEGKTVVETEVPGDRRRNLRTYEVNVPYTEEEALAVAVGFFRSYFVDLPSVVNSLFEEFGHAAIGIPTQLALAQAEDVEEFEITEVDAEKAVQIEIQTETQLTPADQPVLQLSPYSQQAIDEQVDNVAVIGEMIDFTVGP